MSALGCAPTQDVGLRRNWPSVPKEGALGLFSRLMRGPGSFCTGGSGLFAGYIRRKPGIPYVGLPYWRRYFYTKRMPGGAYSWRVPEGESSFLRDFLKSGSILPGRAGLLLPYSLLVV